ncbi:MAG: AtpZ/AtpI family protein [Rhodobacteraceae bacterium]|nr:AtpZ/AtpI family protein [Paracoccaceae bacterium]
MANSDDAGSLEGRIRALEDEIEPSTPKQSAATQAHLAWRMAVELVAGVGMGAGAGFGLDQLFGTAPWLLAIMTLIGFAAGVNLMLRTAREANNSNAKR